MSKYIFSVSNYRAVKKAEIEIDGITVLVGENGAGKSTLSRLLYDVTKVLAGYDDIIERETRSEMLSVLSLMRRSYSFLRHPLYRERVPPVDDVARVIDSENNLVDVKESVISVLNDYRNALLSFMQDTTRNAEYYRARLSTLFSVEDGDKMDVKMLVNTICDRLINRVRLSVELAEEKKISKDRKTFFELISEQDSLVEEDIIDLKFSEDGIDLLERDHFSPMLNIHCVIYYKTYELMDYLRGNSDFHSYLGKYSNKMNDAEKLISRMFRAILKGSIGVSDENLFGETELQYQRNDGLRIPLNQAATGLISFSLLARLLENGFLRKGTLLILDEPEAHLHPKWIVEYARMLVFLQSKLGLKIVLSTHNPDMVSAIDAISRKEKTEENTCFYFATPCRENPFSYVYDKQDNVENIFDSFNVAITRIQEYGED